MIGFLIDVRNSGQENGVLCARRCFEVGSPSGFFDVVVVPNENKKNRDIRLTHTPFVAGFFPACLA